MKALRAPLLLFVLPATLCAVASNRLDWLLLTRDGVTVGEIWRLWTGHAVHFSAAHAGWNLLVLVLAGTWLERVRPGWLTRFTLLGAPLLSLAVIAGEPDLVAYGGLSGLATGVIVLLALDRTQASRMPWPWLGVLLLVAAKSLHDAAGGHALFAQLETSGARPSIVAHAAGAVLGGGAFLLRLIPRSHSAAVSPESQPNP